jgi:hypothetical protein
LVRAKGGLCVLEDLFWLYVGLSEVQMYLVSLAVCALGGLVGGLTYRSEARIGRAVCFA